MLKIVAELANLMDVCSYEAHPVDHNDPNWED